jgi:hypothetical protein
MKHFLWHKDYEHTVTRKNAKYPAQEVNLCCEEKTARSLYFCLTTEFFLRQVCLRLL